MILIYYYCYECGNTEFVDTAATSWPIVPAPDDDNTSHTLVLTFI
jgi:hypothetical protein